MKQVFEHYGEAILTTVVLLALGTILIGALKTGGYVESAFQNVVTSFLTDMKAFL